jgi:protein TonB
MSMDASMMLPSIADGPATPRQSNTRYLPGLAAALAIHAAILFGLKERVVVLPQEQVEFAVDFADASVEVSLVAALPADEVQEEPEPVVEPEPVPAPPVVEPIVEPPPVPETKPPEMTLPEPAPPKPVPQPKPQPKAAPKPKPAARVARASGDGSSAIPGNDATTATASTGGTTAKPGYLRNPHPSYPEEARKAGQQGVVTLRLSVDAGGRPSSVQVIRSSGFPLLDERARSTVAGQWSFKPAKVGGNPVSSQIIIPIRFTLAR